MLERLLPEYRSEFLRAMAWTKETGKIASCDCVRKISDENSEPIRLRIKFLTGDQIRSLYYLSFAPIAFDKYSAG